MIYWRSVFTAPIWQLFIVVLLWLRSPYGTLCVQVYNFNVLEEQPAGHVIGTIECPAQLRDNVSIVFSEKSASLLVDFNATTCRVCTRKQIDREALRDDYIHFTIISTSAESGSNDAFAEVTILVLDVNDNQPKFPQLSKNIFISESANIGDRFELVIPSDADLNFNGFVSNISLVPTTNNLTNAFRLEYTPNEGLLYLVLTKKLDRESEHPPTNITLTLVATDNGFPVAKVGYGNINIIVTDVNDNAPKFAQSNIDIFISEDIATVPHLVIALNVTDLDDGENSRLTYKLSGIGCDAFIVSGNGFIYLTQTLDFAKTAQKYSLVVTATDHGSKPLSSKAALIIHVNDTNNHWPRIRVERGDQLSIQENNLPNHILSLITVSDGDTMNANEYLTLTLQNHQWDFTIEKLSLSALYKFTGLNAAVFSPYLLTSTEKDVSEVRYILRASRRLDREKQASYELVFNASDNKHSVIHTTKVTVTDVNDNMPVISSETSYNVTMSVFSPIGSYLTTVIATDSDVDSDTRGLKYKLENAHLFDVASDTGILFVKKSVMPLSLLLPNVVNLNVSVNDSLNAVFCSISIDVIDKDLACVPTVTIYPKSLRVTMETATQTTLAIYETAGCKTTSWLLEEENSNNNNNYHLFTITDTGDLYLNKKPLYVETTITFTLKVIVWNNLNPNMNTSVFTQVTVSVKPENNNYFERGFYRVTLVNHRTFSVPVTRIHIPYTTADLTYHLQASTDNNTDNDATKIVSVDKASGSVYVSRILPQTTCLFFAVSAKLAANYSSSDRYHRYEALAHVFISNHDFDESRRHENVRFQRRFYAFNIYENSPIGTVIGRVRLDNPTTYTEGIYIETGNVGGILSVTSDGYLIISNGLDREVIPEFRLVIVGVVNCTVTKTNISIRVLDINDNAPFFTSGNIIQIQQHAQQQRPLALVYHAIAQDLDLGSHALVGFELLNNGYGCFCINNKTGQVYVINELNPSLRYRLKIEAFDHGVPRLSSVLNVIVKQVPSVSSSVFHAYLSLKHRVNEPFYRIVDENIDSKSSVVLLNHKDDFGMYPNGWVYLRNKTVRSSWRKSTYRLHCQVIDLQQSVKNVTLIVYIQRKATQESVASSVFTNSTYIFTVSENLPVSSIVGEISLRSGFSTNAVLYIQDRNPWVSFDKKQTLRIRRELDCDKLRRRYDSCLILLQIYSVTPEVNSSCIVVIKVADRNNHGPTFRIKYISIDVREETPVFPKNLLEAIDADVLPNNKIQYQIINIDTLTPIFKINPNNGVLSVVPSSQLDSSKYTLHILAFDPTTPTFNDTLELCINIVKRGCCNKFPSIQSIANVTKISIPENTSVGTIVYKLNINMTDIECDWGDMFFSIETFITKESFFVLHPNSGELQLIKALDYETQSNIHRLTIVMNNRSTFASSVSSQQQKFDIEIEVQNINDNAPMWHSTKTPAHWTVKDTAPVGSTIQICLAKDLDNDVVNYSIDFHDEPLKEFVRFYKNNCTLCLIKSLTEFVSGNRKSFHIKATDGVHTTYLLVALFVQRWSAPVMISPSAVVVPDNGNTGETFYQAQVKEVYEEGIKYALDDADTTLFSINSSSGNLAMASSWPNHFWYLEINVKATTRYSVATTTKLLLFQITSKLSILRFLSSTSTRSLYENNRKDYDLTTVRAQYTTNVVTSNINYYITAGNHGNSFTIGAKTGLITVKESLDRERTGPKVTLTVYAVDLESSVPQTAWKTVEVQVKNQNDNSPVFVGSKDLEIFVPENTTYPIVVATMKAVDRDQDDEIKYKIESGNEAGNFLIDEQNGTVMLRHGLDYENCSSFLLEISAQDNGSPFRSAYTSLTLNVADVNDNVPTFNQSSYFFYADEAFPKGAAIGNVAAFDLDVGQNAKIHFSIASGDYGYFSVDVNSGSIYSSRQLNCDKICVFVLIVRAEDNGKPGLSSTTTAMIQVRRAIQTGYAFEQDVYNIILSENQPINFLVLSPRLQLATIDFYGQHQLQEEEQQQQLLQQQQQQQQQRQQVFYSLFGDTDKFYVTENGSIYLSNKLQNRDEQPTIFFVVVASTQPLTSICQVERFAMVNITVAENRRDLLSHLLETPHILVVSENASVGSVVGRLDFCGGGSSDVTCNTLNGGKYFRVTIDGRVFLLKKLNYEQEKGFEIKLLISTNNNKTTPNTIAQINITVTIFVKDENDNPPLIILSSTNVTVPIHQIAESALSWPHILQINATDADSGSNGELVFELLTFTNRFHIDSQNGSLAVNRNINSSTLFKPGDTFQLQVSVSDRGSPSLKTQVNITVKMIERNTTPYFDQSIYNMSIQENVLPSKEILTLTAKDNDVGVLNSKLSYAIISCFPVDDYFTVDSTSGALILLKPVDREEIAYFNITVGVTDSGTPPQSAQTRVLVTIVDVNDFVPVFFRNNISEGAPKLYENSPVNSYVMTVYAYDLDSGVNGHLSYSLLNNSLHFKIDPQNGVVTTTTSFDYEHQSEYILRVEVRESATPFHKSATDYVIRIIDVNDCPPKFIVNQQHQQPTSPIIVYIASGLPIGSFVTRLIARDMDSPVHSKMVYSLNSTKKFCIDEYTGVVTIAKTLNGSGSFIFMATVNDPTYPYYKDNIQVKVQVVNKTSTQFPIITPPFSFLRIAEIDDIFTRHLLLQLKSERPFSSSFSSQLKFSMESVNTDLFSVNEKNGSLYLLSPLDYEQASRHVIWVSLTNKIYKTLKSHAKIVIYVINVNDNLPRFKQKHLTVEIPEDSPIKYITKVTATDADDDGGALESIYYTINDTVNFTIDQKNGTISRNIEFDYETRVVYHVTVYAANEPNRNRTMKYDVLYLQVIILNANDNPPMVHGRPWDITLSEDFPLNSIFYTVNASDVDGLQPLFFTVENQCCRINPNNGSLNLANALDREQADVLVINITISNGVHKTPIQLTVNILDVNDSPPHFQKQHFNFRVIENITENFTIHTFELSDEDLDENAVSKLEILSNDSMILSFFDLDANRDLRIQMAPLIIGKPRSFDFKIRAVNTAPPFYQAVSQVTVNVIDVNDHHPAFKQTVYTAHLQSTTPYRSTVVVVQATDHFDIGVNAEITYNIFGGNGSSLFDVNKNNGTVTTKASLKRYARQTRTLDVAASDKGVPILSSRCLVHVVIEAKNESPPNIFGAPYAKQIPEDTAVGQEVLQIDGNDYDTGKNLFFSIVQGDSESIWRVENNGSLYLRKSLDYEKNGNYSLTVKVSDATLSNQKSTETIVTIDVTDVNDNAPQFSKPVYEVSIPEDFDVSAPVCTTYAIDADSPANVVTYKLISAPSFFIHNKTGAIYSKNSFDYETQRMFSFAVDAVDSGTPLQRSYANVTVSIIGVNEFPPKFTLKNYFFNISRIQEIGKRVGAVQATDQDEGDGSAFVYEIAIPTELGFSIDSTTGDITVANKLSPGVYNFNAVVLSPEKPSEKIKHEQQYATLYDTATVKIQVNDVTPAPVFTNNSYRISVKEDVKVDQIILTIVAKHYDGEQGMIYKLENGSGDAATTFFEIVSSNGQLVVAAPLDFETTKQYALRASARKPNSAKAYAPIFIAVLDVNDNAPTLSGGSCHGAIVENTLPGFIVTTISNVTDLDEYLNDESFKFSLIDNLDKFSINQTTGVIQNTKMLDHEETSTYELSVVIEDNGIPTQSSNIKCLVEVIDVNDNRGTPRGVTIIATTISYKEKGNRLGDISPLDRDVNNKYNCSLPQGVGENKAASSLVFNKDSCDLYMKPDANPASKLETSYLGQHLNEDQIQSTLNVDFRFIRPSWFTNVVVVYVPKRSAGKFVAEHFVTMETFVNNLLIKTAQGLRVFIGSVQSGIENGVIVVFVLNTSSKIYTSLFRHLIESNLNTIGQELRFPTGVKLYDPCDSTNRCLNLYVCTSTYSLLGYTIINTDRRIYHSQDIQFSTICRCPAGYVGAQCKQTPTTCNPNPCFNNGQCKVVAGVFGSGNQTECTCSKYFKGRYCDKDVNECDHSPCKNGGQCVNKHGGFFCRCPSSSKFQGELCELEISPCVPNPCMNNAQCTITSETRFKCNCPFGDSGIHCDVRGVNFRAASHMNFLHPGGGFTPWNFTLHVEFATVEKDALIMHTKDNTATTPSLMISLKNGKAVVWLIKSSKVIANVQNEATVSDGYFHSLDVTISDKKMQLTIDEQSRAVSSYSASRSTVNFTSISFGGVETLYDIQHSAEFISSPEFIGCMRRIKINGVTMETSEMLKRSVGVTVGCKRRNVCLNNPCGYGNECIDRWSEYECRCHGNYIALNCMRDYQSVRLSDGNSVVRLSLTESERRKELLTTSIRQRREVLMGFDDGADVESSLSIAFRTRKKTGVLFNSTDTNRDNTLIHLSDGYVQYRFQRGNTSGVSSVTNHRTNNGRWHFLDVSTKAQTTVLTLDSRLTTKHTFPTPPHQFINRGVKDYELGRNYIGCIGRIRLNDYTLYLSGSTSLFNVTYSDISPSVEFGCTSTDVCSNSPCKNETFNYCVDQWEKYTCVQPGLCKNNPCENNGHCVPLNATVFSCNCIRTQYGGQRCEVPLVCLMGPCKANEKCKINTSPTTTYKCITNIDTSKPSEDSTSVNIIVIISVVVAIVLMVLFIAFLSSRRAWKRKVVKEKYTTTMTNTATKDNYGFDDDDAVIERFAQPKKKKPRITHVRTTKNATTGKKASQSLPDLRVPSLSSMLSSRVKSVASPMDRDCQYAFGGGLRNTLHRADEGSSRLYMSELSNESLHSCGSAVLRPFESGFESYSDVDIDVDSYSQRAGYQPEIYDLDSASMQFSEMSFQCDEPAPLRGMHYGNVRGIPQQPMQYAETGFCFDTATAGDEISFTDSDSEAYFTCSEYEYGPSRYRGYPGRKNPAYVISRSSQEPDNCKESELLSETSSYTNSTTFSTADSTMSTRKSSKGNRPLPCKKHKSRNLRQKVLSASVVTDPQAASATDYDIGHMNNAYELENVPEAEEYV